MFKKCAKKPALAFITARRRLSLFLFYILPTISSIRRTEFSMAFASKVS